MIKANQPVALNRIDAAHVVAMDLHMSDGCMGRLEYGVSYLSKTTGQPFIVQFNCLLCNEIIVIDYGHE